MFQFGFFLNFNEPNMMPLGYFFAIIFKNNIIKNYNENDNVGTIFGEMTMNESHSISSYQNRSKFEICYE
jgi:hypothetical protein